MRWCAIGADIVAILAQRRPVAEPKDAIIASDCHMLQRRPSWPEAAQPAAYCDKRRGKLGAMGQNAAI